VTIFRLFFLFTLFVNVNLFAYIDSDMDGVADKNDTCLDTPLSDLVNANGCTIKVLDNEFILSLVYGVNYTESARQSNSDMKVGSLSFRADLYYKNYYFETYTAIYAYSGDDADIISGLYDTYVGGGYQDDFFDSLFVSGGVGIILPTYKEDTITNITDYKVQGSVSYIKNRAAVFGNYSYTLINDTSLIGDLQNTHAYSVGAGYYFKEMIYASASYNFANSVYKSMEDIETVSVYSSFNVTKNKSFILKYSYGLSQSVSTNSFSILIRREF